MSKRREARTQAAEKWEGQRQRPPLTAKSDNQSFYLKALRNPHNPVIIASGAAGTGKTYLACTHAADLYLQNKIDKIILCRANIPTGRSLGYFKGDKDDKLANWLMPMIDVIKTRLGTGAYESALAKGNIEFQPLETIRGRSFGSDSVGAFFLIDEAQQMTIDEVKAVCTRVGENCKLVMMGDLAQSDIKETSGLGKLIHLTKKHMLPVTVVDFKIDDIQRSDVCRMFVETFFKEGL